MPKTPKLPGGFKTTVFLSQENKASLLALSTERGAPLLVALNAELTYALTFGLIKPHLQRLQVEAESQALGLRELVQGLLTEYAMSLPDTPRSRGVAQLMEPSGESKAVKTTVSLAPEHAKRLSAVSTRGGLNMSIVVNDELDFVRTYGLPEALLRRLRARADVMQVSLRDLVQLALLEHLAASPQGDISGHATTRPATAAKAPAGTAQSAGRSLKAP